MKRCSRCGEEKNEDGFYKDKRVKDGLWRKCKKCVVEERKEKYNTDPVFREKIKLYYLRYTYGKRRSEGLIPRKPENMIGIKSNPDPICSIIRHHHDEMQHDPERLTTEFLQVLIGRKCK